MSIPTLHCIGCGRAGRSLLHLLHRQGQVRVGAVLNRSLSSAQAAVDFIGAGHAVEYLPAMGEEDGVLLALPDSQLAQSATQWTDYFASGTEAMTPGFAFHLSASQPGQILQGVASRLASCHPALAFADPAQAVAQFPGTWCVVEGEPKLAAMLECWFSAIGAHVIVAPELNKSLYHAAAMTASNALLGVMGLAERIGVAAGLPASEAHQLLCALALRNLHQAQSQGTARALTGPLERGDDMTVRRLRTAMAAANIEESEIWPSLLRLCVRLVRDKAMLDDERIQSIDTALSDNG